MNYQAATVGDDEQWAPVSDLMAVLMLIFMFIAIIFIRTVVEQERVFQEECDKIYRVLETEFGENFRAWDVKLLKDLTIRFRNPDVLFLTGSAEIRPEFGGILSDFSRAIWSPSFPTGTTFKRLELKGTHQANTSRQKMPRKRIF